MTKLTSEQHEALRAACTLISRARASEIRRVKNWQHGMCGCLNAAEPEAPDVTPEEDAAIKRLWETLPGSTCWMTALYMLCNQPLEEEEAQR